VQTTAFIPICARDGHNIASRADWYGGPTVLDSLDAFVKPPAPETRPFRFPVQDIYKFTEAGDQRRILAGTVESGRISGGDRVVFFPSRQASRLKAVASFNRPAPSAGPGEAAGFILEDEPFIRPGELMCREGQPPPVVGSRFRASLFWMGVSPLVAGKKYKLKLGSARATARLARVLNVLDASDMASAREKERVDRHDVAECILETAKPIAFDLASGDGGTARFVLVDNFDIAGAGVILESAEDGSSTDSEHVHLRESRWEGSAVPAAERAVRYGHRSTFVLLTGSDGPALESAGRALESLLFRRGRKSYFLGTRAVEEGLDSDVQEASDRRDELVRRLGELARILTDSGQIFITALTDLDEPEGRKLAALNAPNEIVVVRIGRARPGAFPAGLTLPEAGAEACARGIHQHLIERAVILD